MHRLFFLALISLLSLQGCSTNPATGEQNIILMSEQEEIALGRRAHQQILTQFGTYDDPALQRYVQKIGDNLARKSHRSDLLFRFTVLDSKQVNAFALPGGYIYITRGLMAYLNSEAELAAVLGHEIGHVTARHSAQQQSAAQMANIGAVLGSIFVPGMGTALGSQLTNIIGTAMLRGYGRDHELEADQLGAEYLARTNYTPGAMIDVISVLKDQETFEKQRAAKEGRDANVYHGLFSTHPDNDTRLQEVIEQAKALSNPANARTSRETYLQEIDGMVFGDSPKEGVTRGHHFYHADMGFALSFPKTWHVSNRPDRVIISAPNGDAMLQLTAEDLNKRISPRQFMAERLGLKDLKNGTRLNIHGHEAYTATSNVSTSYGRRESRFTVIFFNQMAYILAGITRDEGKLPRYDNDFMKAMKSFHTLTENERQLAEPLRIKIVQAEPGARFTQLSLASPLVKYPEQQLRLMNDYYPKGEPQEGQLLKVLQ